MTPSISIKPIDESKIFVQHTKYYPEPIKCSRIFFHTYLVKEIHNMTKLNYKITKEPYQWKILAYLKVIMYSLPYKKRRSCRQNN